MRTDDALFVARRNRIAPQHAIAAKLTCDGSSRGKAVLAKARVSCFASRSTLAGIQGTLADHGIAIGYLDHEPNDEGTRIDFRLKEWPLEHVKWNPSREVLETATDGGPIQDIVHGDGRWVVFRKYLVDPWTQEACVLPAALVWAAHAEGIKDWAQASTSHGLAKVIAELPAGIALRGEDGALTPEAAATINMLQGVVSGDLGVGIRPAGSKTDFVNNTSTAWQVFAELITNREKAAARIYLGTDAILGSVGGAPGVDISALFGVATTIIQGDFACIEEALRTGLYEPWTAVNYGDSRYAPALVYELPDPDEAQKSQQHADKLARLAKIVEDLREQQFDVDQDTVNAHARALGINTIPRLAAGDKKQVPLTLAPTDVAKIVKTSEARASQGLGLLGDGTDNMTITERDEYLKQKAEAARAKAEADAKAAAAPPVESPAPVV
jgi:hypothetical protein